MCSCLLQFSQTSDVVERRCKLASRLEQLLQTLAHVVPARPDAKEDSRITNRCKKTVNATLKTYDETAFAGSRSRFFFEAKLDVTGVKDIRSRLRSHTPDTGYDL